MTPARREDAVTNILAEGLPPDPAVPRAYTCSAHPDVMHDLGENNALLRDQERRLDRIEQKVDLAATAASSAATAASTAATAASTQGRHIDIALAELNKQVEKLKTWRNTVLGVVLGVSGVGSVTLVVIAGIEFILKRAR